VLRAGGALMNALGGRVLLQCGLERRPCRCDLSLSRHHHRQSIPSSSHARSHQNSSSLLLPNKHLSTTSSHNAPAAVQVAAG
jgi:hypothetical protein